MAYNRRGTVSQDPRHRQYHAEFIFRHIEILYDRPLIGKGAYGAVRYARCDKLLCAAKLIHALFFDDPNFESLKRDFEDECRLMSNMRHPNVIQYLGYYEEPKSRLPVLLMELLDGSLTHYLERHEGPVPFHTAVNFCHDISLGLDYLHNNNMMHRDLSSNNVLLLGEIKAKITDFGQSRLAAPDANFRIGGDLNKCPGTMVYMPPEALRDKPEYSSMLDTFSFGVLMIQILTRQFPNPGPATRYMPGVGKVPVQEAARRRGDISKVNPKHPVLQLALYCINDDEERRPLIFELCDRFSEFKDLSEYKESQRNSPSAPTAKPQRGGFDDRDRQVEELTDQLQQLQKFIDNQEGELMQLRFKLEKREHELELVQEREPIRPATTNPMPNVSSSRGAAFPPSYQETTAPSPHSSLDSFSRSSLPTPPSSLPSMPTAPPLDVPDLNLSDKKMRWYPCTRTPVPMYGGSAVIFHKRAYINGQGQNVVYEYNPDRNMWSPLPPTPTASFTLVVADSMLTTVGGYTPQNFASNLYSLMEDRGAKVWMQTFPSMKEARVSPGAAATSTHLVVAGGEVQAPRNRFLANTVELFDMRTRQWNMAAKLPKPVKRVSMTVCDDQFFVLGGVTNNNQPLTEVYYCPVPSLASSAHQSDLSRALRGANDSATWRVAGTPLVYSFCATVGSHVLAIGGWDNKASNAIYTMNPKAPVGVNPWSYVGQLAVPRFDSMATVLPGDRLLVVGGRGQFQDMVLNLAEIAVPVV